MIRNAPKWLWVISHPLLTIPGLLCCAAVIAISLWRDFHSPVPPWLYFLVGLVLSVCLSIVVTGMVLLISHRQ